MIFTNKNLIKTLKENGVAIMPTDTLYGIVGRAENTEVVDRIYKLKKRAPEKPCIILIGDINELVKFSIYIENKNKKLLEKYWEGPTSIILDSPEERFAYLHRGTKTLAFRLPAKKELRELLLQTGPLVAPSANPEDLLPAENIEKAKEYFGDSVDIYIDGGEIKGKASKIIKLNNDDTVEVLRN